ncbi:hypothetical protein KAM576c_45960 [Enterobacter asburiae]|nr:hypothetical protein KAM576c_45960 [Enterobacter asburiae]
MRQHYVPRIIFGRMSNEDIPEPYYFSGGVSGGRYHQRLVSVFAFLEFADTLYGGCGMDDW